MKRDALIARRKAEWLSQASLAVRIGKTQNFVSAIERGLYQADVETAHVMAEALHIRAEEMGEMFGPLREKMRQGSPWKRPEIIEKEDEVFLPLREFMVHFVCGADDAERFEREGMPVEEIDGVKMYPKYACHRWYAGER